MLKVMKRWRAKLLTGKWVRNRICREEKLYYIAAKINLTHTWAWVKHNGKFPVVFKLILKLRFLPRASLPLCWAKFRFVLKILIVPLTLEDLGDDDIALYRTTLIGKNLWPVSVENHYQTETLTPGSLLEGCRFDLWTFPLHSVYLIVCRIRLSIEN